ncbi:enoyl-CoA hydratase [Angomonas deanei]|nr:enoyl-CoA hydratase [Angomonas deanei]|eukprot:EPY41789.1 enoyl-CoA hydratase [Angomonas deanei]
MLRLSCLARQAKDSVLKKDFPCSRLLTLNRPEKLNSIHGEVGVLFKRYIRDTPHPKKNAVYIIAAAGKHFSVGGDLIEHLKLDPPYKGMGLWTVLQGQTDLRIQQSTDAVFVSLIQGYLMGGTVGMPLSCQHRVGFESTRFAMPENKIGFYTNGEATWYLPRIPIKGLGLYLALTGVQLKGADVFHAQLCNHYCRLDQLDTLRENLCHIQDPNQVEECIRAFHHDTVPALTFEGELQMLENVFALDKSTRLEDVLCKLEAAAHKSAMAKSALEVMKPYCPLSLKVTLRALQNTLEFTDMKDAIALETCASQKMCQLSAFREGIRAYFIDKTNAPQWEWKTVSDVPDTLVDSVFDLRNPSQLYVFDPEKDPESCYVE